MEAALWDVLAKAANIAQLSGLHIAMLVAMVTSLVWNPRSRQECTKLEQCARELRAIMEWPTGCAIVMQTRREMGELVNKALRDADGLVESCYRSTLWCRVWTGRSMVARFRDMRGRIDTYRGLMLAINGHLLVQPINPPSETNTTMIHQAIDTPSQSVQAVTQCPTSAQLPQRASSIGHEELGRLPENTVDRAGCDIVPDTDISLDDIV